MSKQKTQAQRLHEIVQKIDPELAAAHAETGRWDRRAADAAPAPGASAPYEINELPDGKRRVRVRSADGDVIGGTAATVADAIAIVERKVGLADQEV